MIIFKCKNKLVWMQFARVYICTTGRAVPPSLLVSPPRAQCMMVDIFLMMHHGKQWVHSIGSWRSHDGKSASAVYQCYIITWPIKTQLGHQCDLYLFGLVHVPSTNMAEAGGRGFTSVAPSCRPSLFAVCASVSSWSLRAVNQPQRQTSGGRVVVLIVSSVVWRSR